MPVNQEQGGSPGVRHPSRTDFPAVPAWATETKLAFPHRTNCFPTNWVMIMGRQEASFRPGYFQSTTVPDVAPSPFEMPVLIMLFLAVPSAALMAGGDRPLGLWMREFPVELLPVAHALTQIGEGIQVLVCSGLLWLLSAMIPTTLLQQKALARISVVKVAAAFVFLSVACSGLIALASKYAIGRARPQMLESHGDLVFKPFAMHSDFAALPSGHSATAAAMGICFALICPRLRALFICVGVLICLSRQMVGMHWMSDTLMGWAVGSACTYAIAHLFARQHLLFEYDDGGRLRPRRLSLQ